jgi:hypothetical protein
MAKYIRVNLPVNSPEGTLKLCEEIIEQDSELGVDTVLTGFVNMVNFVSKVNTAKALQKDGDKRTRTSQKKYLRAAKKCGLAKGQTRDTENTVQWFVIQIRDILLGKSRGTEEDLSEFGFNVVISQTGGRRNVRVTIPRKPEDMIALANNILEQHTELDVDTPLTPALVDMTTFEALVGEAETLLDEWNTARGQAQAFHGQAIVILGYGANQTSYTEGTIYYDICAIRDRLLQHHQGTEEDLSEYGFDVVISSSSVGSADNDNGEPVVIEGSVPSPGIVTANTTGINITLATLLLLEAFNTGLRFYFSDSPGGIPGPATVFVDVEAGQSANVTAAQLGFGGANVHLCIENIGMTPGTYRITVG